MKLLATILIISTAFSVFGVDTLQEEEAFDLSRLHFLGDDQPKVQRFFQKMIERDFDTVYEFGSSKFKELVNKEAFTNRLKKSPKIEELQISRISVSDTLGFYLDVRLTEPTNASLGRETLFFWKFEDKEPRFIHYPFGGFPDTLSLAPIYENN